VRQYRKRTQPGPADLAQRYLQLELVSYQPPARCTGCGELIRRVVGDPEQVLCEVCEPPRTQGEQHVRFWEAMTPRQRAKRHD
jgi:hypothetical protein